VNFMIDKSSIYCNLVRRSSGEHILDFFGMIVLSCTGDRESENNDRFDLELQCGVDVLVFGEYRWELDNESSKILFGVLTR